VCLGRFTRYLSAKFSVVLKFLVNLADSLRFPPNLADSQDLANLADELQFLSDLADSLLFASELRESIVNFATTDGKQTDTSFFETKS
jgi:hypothetical protein